MPSERVCSRADLFAAGRQRVQTSREPIALFVVAEKVYAVSDTCTHMEFSLCEGGIVDGDEIECVWHNARFCLRTGDVLAPPAYEPLRTFAVRVEGDDVLIELP
jgi:3-phenylpropionate/trans-cinnamate dioxygenase ferredoxin component